MTQPTPTNIEQDDVLLPCIKAAYARYPDLELSGVDAEKMAELLEMSVLLSTKYTHASFVHKMLLQSAYTIRKLIYKNSCAQPPSSKDDTGVREGALKIFDEGFDSFEKEDQLYGDDTVNRVEMRVYKFNGSDEQTIRAALTEPSKAGGVVDVDDLCKVAADYVGSAYEDENMAERIVMDTIDYLASRNLLSTPNDRDELLRVIADLANAAKSVIERWESPVWKDLPATANFINHLRNNLDKNSDIIKLAWEMK